MCALPLAGAGKNPGEQLFDAFDATDLNRTLKEAMDGLSAKVLQDFCLTLFNPVP